MYATTADGLRLPVIDVTHPAFAVPDDPASLAARRDALLALARRNRWMPAFLTRQLMRLAAPRSPLLRSLLASDRDYLDSITTYILKLGPDHLPPGFDSPVDRQVAASPHMPLIRLRMQQIARLLAEALLAPLGEAPDAPLDLVNIAGGPALDSINALIVLARNHASLLRRPIAIHVFDSQQEGPAFGARALVELTAPDGPLHGLEVQFQHHAYDWNDTAPLARLLAGLAARGAVIAASSEGGLFEYGSDEAVVANLTVLARSGVPIVAGSVTSSSKLRKRMIAHTKFQLFARGLEGFAPLAEQSGYHVAESRTALMSEQVLLRSAGPSK
ncbi:hypothetical protein SAZ10_00585 [Mesorhizobium sp. BAC0120]|uniref:hypothetical protein n=1 Tax=Mesorhizobium sp. BAC0120 TaxID=3090670 RepID=UPI00298C4E04|nr:hypothetical protein [Mesorhizobium sp. BAC0120]MDW6020252.1 hypothetical protein [Mesorhizobium sp. BAC0120]